MRIPTPATRPGLLLVALLTIALALSCSRTPTQPTVEIRITAIAPAVGSAAGGTFVTITGENFDAGTTVLFGAVSGLNVTVAGPTMLTAISPPAGAGAVDVVVQAGGQSARLPGGYTYVATDNAAPVITGITAQGTSNANEPPSFAGLSDDVTVTAMVTDADTPIDRLTFVWSAPVGAFTGSGPVVTWRSPATLASTPTTYTLTLTVIETYEAAGASGGVVAAEHRVSETVTVAVHDLDAEVGGETLAFLNSFADSSIPAARTVENFSDAPFCGKSEELSDVQQNRDLLTIDSFSYALLTITYDFGGTCDFRSRRGDACVRVLCEWHSTYHDDGHEEVTAGTCILTAVYEPPAGWQMCWSEFVGSTMFGRRFPF